MFQHYLSVINGFLEGTGIVITMAYLLSRGRMLNIIFHQDKSLDARLLLGVLMGFIGATEVIFPGARSPYVMDTLAVSFAVLSDSLLIGVLSASVILIFASIIQPWPIVSNTFAAVYISAAITNLLRKSGRVPYPLITGLAAGGLSQLAAVLMQYIDAPIHEFWHHIVIDSKYIFANAFGMMLMTMVLNDAWIRQNSEKNRIEAMRSRELATEAKIASLRSRVHPHFLYNALASIAGLCCISPDKAEQAIVKLGGLMRHTLDVSTASLLSLDSEIEHVKMYLSIEQLRMPRLSVDWDIDPACSRVMLPPFSLQILVENAVIHGISPKIEDGTITIKIHKWKERVVILVSDTGVGLSNVTRHAIFKEKEAIHGIRILNDQLVNKYGTKMRLRIFTKQDYGTITSFVVPLY